VVAFLALLGNAAKKESSLGIEISVAVLAMVVWAVALAAAGAGVRAGHESQQWFSRAVRARRQLMEHRLLGPEAPWIAEEVVQGKPDPAAPGRLRDAADASQEEWLALTRCSLGGFIMGAFFAAAAVMIPVLFAAGPLWDPGWDLIGGPYNRRTWVTGLGVALGILAILVITVVGGVRLGRRRRGRRSARSTSTFIDGWVKRLLENEDLALDFAAEVTWAGADGSRVAGIRRIGPEIDKLRETLRGAKRDRIVVDAASAFVEFAVKAHAAVRASDVRFGVACDVRGGRITAVRCYGPVPEVTDPGP
jgi:hypothetical protein